jgi:short-subunit dehydrogenase
LKIGPEEYKRVTEVTYLGVVYGTMAALKSMAPRNSGVIVQVASALAYQAIPLQSAYCGAKHAIRGFTNSLRIELMHDGLDIQLTMVQLPALNTPQFTWNLSRMRKHPRPVPPNYHPEVAAEAILWATRHKRREVYVATPTSSAIMGAKLFPGLTEKFLAKNGYLSQQTDQLHVDPDRPSNLFAPVPEDRGAHGPFDAHSRRASWQFWLTTRLPLHGLVDTLAGFWVCSKL